MMDLHVFCEEMGFDGAAEERLRPHWAELLEHSTDTVPLFMQRPFYEKYYPLCNGPDGVLERMDQVSAMLPALPNACRYAAMLHYGLYVAEPQMPLRFMPETTRTFGENAGIFQLMVVLSSLELCERKYASMGIPYSYFVDVSDKVGSNVYRYMKFHDGIPGYEPNSSAWTRHEVNGMLFRLGRLEFLCSVWDYKLPAVFRHRVTGEYVSLCPSFWFFDEHGLMISLRSKAAFETRLEFTSDTVTGTPLDQEGFPLVGKTRTLSLKDWESAVNPWELVLDVHVPSGAPLTWDCVLDAFRKARDFFPKYLHLDVKAFKCGSWLFNPDLARELPESNIATFQRHVHLGPILNNPHAGLDFVYGDANADPLALPATNAMHRAFRKFRQNAIPLKWGMMTLMADEI